MGGFKMSELLVILAIALLLFGGRVAGLGGSLGQAIRNFKKGLNGDDAEPAPNAAANAPAQQNTALASTNGVEAKPAEAATPAPAAQKS